MSIINIIAVAPIANATDLNSVLEAMGYGPGNLATKASTTPDQAFGAASTHLFMSMRAATMAFQADLLIYLAGADVFEGDRLGRLALTQAGVARRDAMVFEHARRHRLPVAVAMAGGYCADVEPIVAIHLETVRQAADHAQRSRDSGTRGCEGPRPSIL